MSYIENVARVCTNCGHYSNVIKEKYCPCSFCGSKRTFLLYEDGITNPGVMGDRKKKFRAKHRAYIEAEWEALPNSIKNKELEKINRMLANPDKQLGLLPITWDYCFYEI